MRNELEEEIFKESCGSYVIPRCCTQKGNKVYHLFIKCRESLWQLFIHLEKVKSVMLTQSHFCVLSVSCDIKF